jgi:hypothetical protein
MFFDTFAEGADLDLGFSLPPFDAAVDWPVEAG